MMQQQSSFPLPQPLDSPQPPSEGDIKKNLQKYSPFYRQAMHFNGEGVETLFYVAHNNFSSEKALKKLEAFGLFKEKKIVFVEYGGAERGPVRDAVGDGNVEGALDHPRGNSAHFTVKVKDKDSDTFRELEISADGKCGITSSMVALNEILRGDTKLLPEVLLRGDTDASGDPHDGDIVQSNPINHFDDLLKKIYRSKVVKNGDGKDVYGDLKLHHCVRDDFTSESPEFQQIFGNLSPQSLEKVEKLLTRTQESDWLTPKQVHEIISTNVAKLDPAKLEKVANISPQHIHEIPSDGTMARGAVAVIPSSVLKGVKQEGIELRKDAKHEFRIIVLNILHEWIKGKGCDFSKIHEDKFLESLIKDKLGDKSVEKIKTELGGKITFKSLLAIDEVEDQPRPLNRDDQLKVNQLEKEREAFYSAQCSFDAVAQEDGVSKNLSNKVWERIKNIVDKYCSEDNFQTTNTDFNASFKGALEKIIEMPETNNEGLISSTLTGFDDKIGKITGVAPPAPAQTDSAQPDLALALALAPAPAPAPPAAVPPAPAHAPAQPDLPGHGDARFDLPAPAPTADPHKVGADDSLGQLGGLMETALGVINKAFDELGNAIKSSCEEARKNLLEKVKEMEEMTKKPGNAPVNQDNKQTSEIPDNNILKPIFYALRSCLGEERK